jgi:type VI secretion system protein ImpH
MGSEIGVETAAMSGAEVVVDTAADVAASEPAPESRPQTLRAVEAALRRSPSAFSFFQAVRLLEKLRPDRAGVGHFVDPADEVVRFSASPSIAFPPGEIQALELPDDSAARMTVNFMGLTGPQGVLPYHYTLLVSERMRARDRSLGAFFSLFDHRIISLFYRAWVKHRFAIGHEDGTDDRLTAHLLDLIGLGTEAAQGRIPVPDETLIYYAGLIGPQQRSAVALEQLLGDFLGVAVEVQQFVGGWYPLAAADQCKLGDESGAASQLGRGAAAGDEVWDQQMRVRIRMGPLTRGQFDQFLPTGSRFEELRMLTRFFAHDQYSFEAQLVLARDEVPGFTLGAEDASQPLGWATWIRSSGEFSRDADETIFSF